MFRLVIKLIDHAQGKIGRLSAFAIAFMTFLGALNAVLRYCSRYIGLNLSSNAYLEAQWYLFAFVFLIGAPYTLSQNRHVRVDVLYGRFSKPVQHTINLIGHLFLLLPFCGFGIWASYHFALDSWTIREMSPDAGGLPRYIVKALIPVGFFLLGIQAIVEILRHIDALMAKNPSESQENPS